MRLGQRRYRLFESTLAAAAAAGAHVRAICGAARSASGIVRDYVFDLYYPIHGASWRDKLHCSPVLLFIEYLVYRADAVAEAGKDIDLDVARSREYAALAAYKARFIRVLERLALYDRCVEREIERGEQYLRLENRVTSSGRADHGEVMRLAELRPSDVRLLHCLLFGLLDRPCDEALLSLLWPVEVIADIGNDFRHYAGDVARGRYNTYDVLVRLHGDDATDVVRSEIARYERQFLDRLAGFPVARRPELRRLCARLYRRHTATIPAPIRAERVQQPRGAAS